MADPSAIPLTAAKKRLSAPEKHPLSIENILRIRDLDTICPSLPTAEFWSHKTLSAADWQRNLAALACIFRVNSHFTIDIITRTPYIPAARSISPICTAGVPKKRPLIANITYNLIHNCVITHNL